jgi:hypothetical protein
VSVHIYTAQVQPLTRYVDDVHYESTHVWEIPADERFTCCNCGRKRQARFMSIRVYYDASYIFCTERCQARHWLRREQRWSPVVAMVLGGPHSGECPPHTHTGSGPGEKSSSPPLAHVPYWVRLVT